MKSLKNLCNIYIYIFIYLIIAVFYLWMADQIPYTHDDWDWGAPIGMEQFLHATVNSRYVGNFFEIVMTRSEFLKTVIMGTTYFLIPYLLVQIAAAEQGIVEPGRKLLMFLLCNCMLLTMNHIMWREVYGWTAGFANFGMSALFLLLWLKELLKAFDREPVAKRDSLGKVILYLVAGFCGQLFIENLAIYCVLLACVLCGIYYFRSRMIPYSILALTIGAVAGLIVMFSSSIYQSLFTTGYAIDGYRVIPMIGFDSFSYALSALRGQILVLAVKLYFNNVTLTMLVLATFLCVLRYKKGEIELKLYTGASLANCVLLLAFIGWYLYDKQNVEHPLIASYIQFALAVTYFCVITFEVFACFGKDKQGKLVALWLSAPMLIAPLLVAGEQGQRLFFSTNIIVLLFLLIVSSELMSCVSNVALKRFGNLCLCVMLLLGGFYGRMYTDIGVCKTERENRIDEAVESGQKEIILPAFPHQDYLHFPDTDVDWRIAYFKEFYGIPADVELVFESLEQSAD